MSRRIAGSIVCFLGLGVSAWWGWSWLRPLLATASGRGALGVGGGVGAVSAGMAELAVESLAVLVVPFLVFLAIRRLTARAVEFPRLVRVVRVGHLVVTVAAVTLGVASYALLFPLLNNDVLLIGHFVGPPIALTFLPIQFFFLVSAAAVRIASAPRTV